MPNKVSTDDPKVLSAGVMVSKRLGEGLPSSVNVRVLLPFDVRDIASNFAHYWSMPDLDAIKIRWKNIGALGNQKAYTATGKLLLAGGVVGVVFAVLGFLGGFVF